MVALIGELADESLRNHPLLGSARAQQIERAYSRLPPTAPSAHRAHLLVQRGLSYLGSGELDRAIEVVEQAHSLLDREAVPAAMADQIRFYAGLIYLRLGEVENCCEQRNKDSCILPLRGGAIHSRPRGSRTAIRYFREVIDTSQRAEIRIMARWLMNIAYMSLGQYPDGVPLEDRVPPEQFAPIPGFPRFVNIAEDLGLDTFNNAGGAVIDDLTQDGYLDVLTSSWEMTGPMRFFVNQRDGTFRERSKQAGLEGMCGALNMVQGDYNNDGILDVYLMRGAWGGRNGRYPNSLLKNNGDGTFTDVSFDAGLAEVHYPTLSAAWGDFNNDGLLDLYVGNESTAELTAPSQLFRNNGDGTFHDVAREAGVANLRHARGVTWGDYNEDGWLDLYVSNLSSPNRLYHNNGDGTFRDMAREAGVERPIRSFPTWFWDYDNDGHLDLFVSSYDGTIVHVAAHFFGIPPRHEPSRLYRGDGRGHFTDVTEAAALTYPMLTMGCNFGDLDSDGYLDFYIGTGDPTFESLMPSVLFLNQQGRRFLNVTASAGLGHLQKGHGVAFADLDHDGDNDLFEQMGGAYPADKFSDALYENPGFGNRSIGIELRAVRGNRCAIGARLKLEIVDSGQRRTIYRHVNSGGSFGCNPLRQTIGLGSAQSVDRLEVLWPVSGTVQVFEGLAAGQIVRIVENETVCQRLELKTLRLGSPAQPARR
jgi:hypothetical protein